MTDNFETRRWRVGHGRYIDLGPRGHLMGIVNVTPDSFSDGGLFDTADAAIAAALDLEREGAAIVDIGGESTRPGAREIDARTEQARIMPVIEAVSQRSDVLISVDTYRAQTARMAFEAGAHIINDVWGLQKDSDIAATAAELGAGVCIMHTGRERRKETDVIADQRAFLSRSVELALGAGLPEDAIILDPGFGFAKDKDENVELMARFAELHDLGFPLIAGTSRKRFVGAVSGREMHERDVATAATTVLLRMEGAGLFRVHDVAKSKDALAMADAALAVKRDRKLP